MSHAMNSNCPKHGRQVFINNECQVCRQVEIDSAVLAQAQVIAEMRNDFMKLTTDEKLAWLFDFVTTDE